MVELQPLGAEKTLVDSVATAPFRPNLMTQMLSKSVLYCSLKT